MQKNIVNKFGWEIMGFPELNFLALENVKVQIEEWYKVFVVCSALTKITDKLIDTIDIIINTNSDETIKDFCKEILEIHIHHTKQILKKEENIKILEETLEKELKDLRDSLKFIFNFWYVDFVVDKVVSFWEKFSTHIINIFFQENWINTKRFTWEEIWIITDSNYNDANINYEKSKKYILENIKNSNAEVIIIAWFTWIDKLLRTTTLWRGWTDTTACLIWAITKTKKVILWKNVNWVLTSDPRIVKNTKTIDYLDYDEAEESWKVVCNKAIEYLKINNTPMEVAYIKDKNQKTLVWVKKDYETHIKLLSYMKDCSLLKIKSVMMTKPWFLYKISEMFYEYEVNMSFIRNTRDIMYIAIENNQKNIPKLYEKLRKISTLTVDKCSIINIIWNLDWELAIRVNTQLKKISKKPQIWVFPHENCFRLEAIVASDELENILNNFHEEFIN